jgi:outer membrane protein assembly factor BamB
MRRSFRLLWTFLVAAAATTAFTAPVSAGPNWPGFRGPTGLGHTDEKDLPLKWDAKTKENVLWSAPLVGKSHSSPAVWGDRVFVTTVAWPPDAKDDVKKKEIPVHHVTCYATADGKQLWDTVVPPGPWVRTDFRSGDGGGYCAPSPAADGKHVYVMFGSSVLAALDFNGKIVWRKEIVPFTFDVCPGSSPVLHRDLVILLMAMANPKDSKVVAFDRATGETRWEQKLPGVGFSHSTPVLVEIAGKLQIVFCASGGGSKPNGVQSLDPDTGKPIWWCTGGGDAASPAFGGGLIYCDSGRGGPGVAIDPTGTGDVGKTHVKWTVAQVPEGLGSPIIVGEHVYRLHGPGVLKCWNLRTGEQAYAERIAGINSRPSPLADPNGNILFLSGGKSFVIRAGPKFEILATNDLGDPGDATAAVAGGRIFIKGGRNLWCIGKK